MSSEPAAGHGAGQGAGSHDGHAATGPAASGHDVAHDAGHDAHGHEGMGLGPVDVRMWATGILGVLIGLAGAWCFAVSTGRF